MDRQLWQTVRFGRVPRCNLKRWEELVSGLNGDYIDGHTSTNGGSIRMRGRITICTWRADSVPLQIKVVPEAAEDRTCGDQTVTGTSKSSA